MHAWNTTTMTMAKPRRLVRARLDLVMLRTAIAFPHTGKVDRGIAPRRESEGPAAFFGGCYYALIHRPYNDCLPGLDGKTPLQSQQGEADRGVHVKFPDVRRAWAAIRTTDERAGRASAFGPAPLEKAAHSRAGGGGGGAPPAQARRALRSAPAGRHANDGDRRRGGPCRSRGPAPSAQRPLRSLFPPRRLRRRHREAAAGFHLADRRRRARSRALLRLSARPRASVPGGARGRGRGLSLARRPVRSPADRLHGRLGGRRAG